MFQVRAFLRLLGDRPSTAGVCCDDDRNSALVASEVRILLCACSCACVRLHELAHVAGSKPVPGVHCIPEEVLWRIIVCNNFTQAHARLADSCMYPACAAGLNAEFVPCNMVNTVIVAYMMRGHLPTPRVILLLGRPCP